MLGLIGSAEADARVLYSSIEERIINDAGSDLETSRKTRVAHDAD
jgi:hypothetical protein